MIRPLGRIRLARGLVVGRAEEEKQPDPKWQLGWLGTRAAIAGICAERARESSNPKVYLEWVGYANDIDLWVSDATAAAELWWFGGYIDGKLRLATQGEFRSKVECGAGDRQEIGSALSYMKATRPEEFGKRLSP